ncbi:MAG: hypothetical protein ACI8QS_002377 [Planctomycetota bacterium]|jgi:hypothetical protein
MFCTNCRVLRSYRDSTSVPAHRREETTIPANTRVCLLWLWINVFGSSCWSLWRSKRRTRSRLNTLAAAAAKSSHRVTVFHDKRSRCAMADLLMPSTLSIYAAKSSHGALQALVGCTRGSAEGLAALLAAISASAPPLHFGEAVQHDVALVVLAVASTLLVGARRSPPGLFVPLVPTFVAWV